MEICRGVSHLNPTAPHSVVTIGNFDGVHLGHQKIIGLAIEQAKARQGTSIAFTFKPHPQAALNPHREIQLLTTYPEKLEIFGELGVDIAVEEPFSREFSTIEPEQFFNEYLLKKLGAECIVVGYDFGFGRNRGGHLDILKRLCTTAGTDLIIVPPLRLDHEIVSSSQIRSYLLNGQIAEANALLGRRFRYQGIVAHGDGRGRQIGFATANIKPENKLTLPFGVYATFSIFGGNVYPSVTNVGIRPTFQPGTSDDQPEPLVETHLINQNVDLYGHLLEVQFVSRIRSEIQFKTVAALKSQIQNDLEEARKHLSHS